MLRNAKAGVTGDIKLDDCIAGGNIEEDHWGATSLNPLNFTFNFFFFIIIILYNLASRPEILYINSVNISSGVFCFSSGTLT